MSNDDLRKKVDEFIERLTKKALADHDKAVEDYFKEKEAGTEPKPIGLLEFLKRYEQQ